MFKKFQALGKAIKSVTPNVPTTKKEKLLRDLKITKQKVKGATAKLKQTQFERANPQFKGKDFTFKTQTGKSESNKERYKRIQKENTKAFKGMIDRAFKNVKDEKKATGGRVGRKFGSPKPKKRMQAKKGSRDPKKKKKFPDLTGDGKVTFADILKGRGVINGKKKKTKKKII